MKIAMLGDGSGCLVNNLLIYKDGKDGIWQPTLCWWFFFVDSAS